MPPKQVDRPSRHYLVYVVITLLMVGSLLSWQAWTRTDKFQRHHRQLAATSVTGAVDELEVLLSELRRSLRLFAYEQNSLLEKILNHPDDDAAWARLEERVNRHFPEHFGFTLTEQTGKVLRPDFDSLVEEVCQQDIQSFITQGYWQQTYIHANPLGYHFDVMVPWGETETPQGVFFLSFRPNVLAQALQRMQPPKHHLFLLRRDRPGLIEVSEEGARNVLQREFFLDAGERQRIMYSFPVGDTGWDLVDLPTSDLFQREAVRNWSYAALVFIAFVAVGMLMIYQVGRREVRRVQAESALRASEERYRLLVDTMTEGLAMQDEHGTVTYVNDRFCEMTGYSRDQLLGKPAIAFIGKANMQRWRELMKTRRKGRSDTYEADFTRPDGRVVHFVIAPQRVVDEQGNFRGSFGVFTDITEHKETEERALQHQSDLAHVARLSVMGEMASGLAHELNQPLSAISTYCRAGLRIIDAAKNDIPEKLAHALEQSAIQAQRAGAIIRRMRQFASKGKTQRSRAKLNAVIQDTLGFIESEMRKAGVTVERDLAERLPPVSIDRIQIEQVILNLMRNALEAMIESGTDRRELTIRTRLIDDSEIQVTVQDTGPGLGSATEQIFDTFHSTKEDGMGLGLAISQSIVEAHGGQLWADHRPGPGATFHFTLPVREA
jgi:PAS domain S-box-containing protein